MLLEDALVWTWENFRKKRQTRALWHDSYGEFLSIIFDNADDWATLCLREDKWSEVGATLAKCTQSRLGKKVFAGLDSFVHGARVARAVKLVTDKWLADGAKITTDMWSAETQRVADEVTAVELFFR